MSPESPLITETKRRLIHLRSMPVTPMRHREILALERVLENAGKPAPKITRERKSSRQERADEEEDEAEAEPTKPLRRVEQGENHRKVILRAVRKEQHDDEKDIEAEKRALKARMDNTLSVLGLTHRGMS